MRTGTGRLRRLRVLVKVFAQQGLVPPEGKQPVQLLQHCDIQSQSLQGDVGQTRQAPHPQRHQQHHQHTQATHPIGTVEDMAGLLLHLDTLWLLEWLHAVEHG